MFTPVRLAIARKRRGMTLTRLAERVGLTAQSLSNAERGRQEPSETTLRSISEVLSFPPSFFLASEPTEIVAEQVSFRARSKTSARARDAALSAATLAVELHAWIDRRFELPKTNIPTVEQRMTPEVAAAHVRARWGLNHRAGISNVVHLLEANGVAVYSLPPEYGDVDAFSFWIDGRPFVLLNPLKSAERGRFDGAHELGHLVLHGQPGCNPDSRMQEKEANAFASAFLMPEESVKSVIRMSPTTDEILRYKTRWRVSALALTYRLHELDIISDWGYRRAIVELGQMGFRSDEPDGLPREQSYILQKVLPSLRASGTSFRKLSAELNVYPSDLNEIMFGLAVVPVLGRLSGSPRQEIRVNGAPLHAVPGAH
jgi:Zn-dependent peptidase ImmA (M78 family)/DNA-binding XRE family transcriptional regulator